MAIARYKYAATTVQERMNETVGPGEILSLIKSLEGSLGVLFRVTCSYGAAATQGLSVQVVNGMGPAGGVDSMESVAMAVEMPLVSGSSRILTLPVLLPEVGPRVGLNLVNTTGDTVSLTVMSRMIEGVEVV